MKLFKVETVLPTGMQREEFFRSEFTPEELGMVPRKGTAPSLFTTVVGADDLASAKKFFNGLCKPSLVVSRNRQPAQNCGYWRGGSTRTRARD